MKACVDLIVGLLAVVETREQAPLAEARLESNKCISSA